MIFLASWWKAIAGAAGMTVIALLLHSLSVAALEKKHALALTAQAAMMTAQCNSDKSITEGVSHDYQSSLTNLDDVLSKRVHAYTACISGFAGEATRFNGSSAPKEHGQPHGLSTRALYEYAGTCERYRLQVIGLQTFINKTWER